LIFPCKFAFNLLFLPLLGARWTLVPISLGYLLALYRPRVWQWLVGPVVLIALWVALQALRKDKFVFSLTQRRYLWFWMVVATGSLLLAFGRFALFYSLLYTLPYFSTIRNPAKFTHVVNWALVVLFAYGLHGLSRFRRHPK